MESRPLAVRIEEACRSLLPDPDDPAGYTARGGSRQGHCPPSPEIGSAMFRDDTPKPGTR